MKKKPNIRPFINDAFEELIILIKLESRNISKDEFYRLFTFCARETTTCQNYEIGYKFNKKIDYVSKILDNITDKEREICKVVIKKYKENNA